MMYRVKKDGLAFFVSSAEKAKSYKSNGYEIKEMDAASSSQDGEAAVSVSVTGVGRSKPSNGRGTRQ
ncbi:hypothetical protein ACR77U_13370 [Enterococcus faecium]|uniref:hypothetical protein n=1 Tax=Enterococcus faecium TaxID=1352 RepID=UPI003DA5800B